MKLPIYVRSTRIFLLFALFCELVMVIIRAEAIRLQHFPIKVSSAAVADAIQFLFLLS